MAFAQPEQPNVILIIGDDVGWPYHGFMPSPQTLLTNEGPIPVQAIVRTPNLDRLASEGVTFSHGYTTASVCLTSLMAFLSAHGLHSLQWSQRELELEAIPQIGAIPYRRESRYYRTLPRELQRRGYVSWEGGKMWSGTYADAGFTHGLATSVGGLFESVGDRFGREGWDPVACGSTGNPAVSCPALDPLRDFLDETQGSPFFVWFAPMLPHVPNDAAQVYRDPYEALGLAYFEVDYLANLTWLDELIGELMSELEARGIADDTLVVYASDNGWGLGFQFFAGFGKGKGTLYDLGFRTPMVFHWPGRVPEGVVYDDLVSTSDIPATVLDYVFGAGGPFGSEGMSLRDRIEGGVPVGRSEIITHHLGDALVNDSWRYLLFPDGHEELYRIDIDPFEEVDLAAANPALLATFAARVEEHEQALLAPQPRVEIVGRLLDAATGEPLRGAELKLRGGRNSLISIVGPDGWFRFGPLESSPSFLLRRNRRVANDFRAHRTGSPFARAVPLTSTGIFNSLAATPTGAATAAFGASVSGTLVDADTGAPLSGSLVRVSGRVLGRTVSARVETQPDGSFRVDNLAAGATYRLAVGVTSSHRGVVVRDIEIASSEDAITIPLVAEPK